MIKKLFLFFILPFVFFSCGENEFLEKENNNNFRSANPIKLNSYVMGELANAKDLDFYVLDLRKEKPQKHLVKVNLTRVKGFDLQIKIYHGRKLIKTIDDYRKSQAEGLENLFVKNEVYYIAIAPGKFNPIYMKERMRLSKQKIYPSQRYKLTITGQAYEYSEKEPNDSIASANTLILNQEIKGYFSPFKNANELQKLEKTPFNDKNLEKLKPFDFDWYQFKIPQAGDHNLDVILDPVKDVDSIIAVYQNNKLLKYSNNKGRGKEERISNLKVNGNKTGYIVVIGVPDDYRVPTDKAYPYQLAINVSSRTTLLTESEDNNSIEKANLISENKIHGFLSPKDDVDYYKIQFKNNNGKLDEDPLEKRDAGYEPNYNLSENEFRTDRPESEDLYEDAIEQQKRKSLSIKLSGIPSVDLSLLLYDKKGNLIKEYDNNPTNEGEEVHSYDISSLKEIYIAVKGGKNNKGENFKNFYALTTEIKNHDWAYELEPNDKKPNPMKVNMEMKGYLNPRTYRYKGLNLQGDIDIYEISLKEGKSYDVILKGVKDVQLELKLYHSANFKAVIKELKLKGNENEKRSFSIKSFESFHNPDANIYRIEIKSKYGKTANDKTPYTLLVKEK